MDLIKLLEVDTEFEVKLAMPNEIFTMLINEVENGNIKQAHLPFAYSYLYLTTYLYRYGKYEQPMARKISLKEMLGMNAKEKRVDYLIKKNGVFDEMKLTETTNQIPVGYEWQDEDGFDREFVKIKYMHEWKVDLDDLYEEYRKSLNVTNRTTIKMPRFAYTRDLDYDIDSADSEYDYNGTFYHADRTHIIDFRVFDFCMQHEDLGVYGFYIYSYLKHKNDLHKDGYDASRERLSNELGLSTATVSRYRDALRSYNMIELVHNTEYFSSHMNKEELLAPTNYINTCDEFSNVKIDYVKFLDSITRKDSRRKIVKFNIDGENVELDINQLPF